MVGRRRRIFDAVPALHKKLLRDLWRLAGPSFAVAVIVASGITAYVTLRGAYVSLEAARSGFYVRSAFADVFAHAVRVPMSVAREIELWPGVDAVDARLAEDVVVDVADFSEPVRARLTSFRVDNRGLNRITLRSGHLPERDSGDEVVMGEALAVAHKLKVGDTVNIVIAGRRRAVRVAGVGVSPEFVYVVPPGSVFPDDQRYGVMWMPHGALAALLGATGTFNDLALKLQPGTDERQMVADLERRLTPWGGLHATLRKDQVSHRYVDEELNGLEVQTFAIPLVFLAIASLILHMVLVRLVESQREIVGLLKAIGYKNRELVVHYTALAMVIVLVGAALGVLAGRALGDPVMLMYKDYFRYDVLAFQLSPRIVVIAVGISVASGLAGAVLAVQRVVRLQPAAAMQPPAPPAFSAGLLEGLHIMAALASGTRMVVRQVARRPGRSALTALGMSFAVAIIVVASAIEDSVNHLVDLTFTQVQREDVELTVVTPWPVTDLRAAAADLPGVLQVEPTRLVPIRLRNGPLTWEGALEAREHDVDPDHALRLLLDTDARALPPLPDAGLVLTAELAKRLDVLPGQQLLLERLDGDLRVVPTRVTGLSRDFLGLHAAADLHATGTMLGDGDVATGALLLVEGGREAELGSRLKQMPRVAGTQFRKAALASFRRLMAETYTITRWFLSFFASLIAVGIVYNSARIALAERARELATLRVLGLTRREVSSIFLGEQLLLVAVAIPLGWLVGRALTTAIITSIAASDLYRFPVVVGSSSYVYASIIVLGAGLVTALLARRRLDKLDLVSVLKARE